jgi:porphobilinogen synthase
MSYATKFASACYGPYREAIGTSGLLKGDKKTYYIDPANTEKRCARPRPISRKARTW